MSHIVTDVQTHLALIHTPETTTKHNYGNHHVYLAM